MSRQNGSETNQIVDEIWNSLVLLQSIFSPIRNNNNTTDQLQIDETYSILRRLFSRYREYQTLQEQMNFQTSSPDRYKQERLELYFNALLGFWQQTKKSNTLLNQRSHEILRDTRETLRSIIQQHQGSVKNDQYKYTKQSPIYKSPASSKQRLTDKQVSETRQKTEPVHQQQNQSKSELREKELLLKKSQQTIQVLQEDNQNMMRLNQQFKSDLQSLHEENNKKTIKVQMMEMQLDVIKRKSVQTQQQYSQQKDQDKEFRSHSYHQQQSNDTSPYRNEDEVFQLRQDKNRLSSEVTSLKKNISDLQSNKKGLSQSKSETDLKFIVSQQQAEIEELRQKLHLEKKSKTGDRKFQHQISNLEIEVESMKDQITFQEEQIFQLKGENQSLKEFVQDQLTKNKNFMQQINDLQHENETLKVSSNRRVIDTDSKKITEQQKQEVKMLRSENQQILDENERLSQKISELYLELNQKNNNDDLTTIRQLQLQNQGLQEQTHKGSEDRKRLTSQLDMLKKEIQERDNMIQTMQKQKQQKNQQEQQEQDSEKLIADPENENENENEEDNLESAIKVKQENEPRFLPELGVGSHFNCVVHVLETLNNFSPHIAVNSDDSCQILQRIFDYIRGVQDFDLQQLKDDATMLSDIFLIEQQADNRANDFFFQIIDSFSRIIFKTEGQEMSALAKIIQQKDSPVFDNFFFLQRSLPLSEEIQFNEVPLINSIKHVRYIEPQAKDCDNLAQYINQLIVFEGEENNGSSFNFVVLPDILILNVFELSQAKINMTINQYIDSSVLSNEPLQEANVFQYKLSSMIHCSQGLSQDRNDPLYYLTINTSEGWVQVLYDQFEQINKIDQILTFRKNQGDKELLIYQKMIV